MVPAPRRRGQLRERLGICVAGVLLGSLTGCPPRATVESPVGPMETTQEASDLTFGPGDVFDVRVFNEPDLSGTYRVNSDGTIDYPLVGQLKVEGLDAHTVSGLVADRLREKFVRQPQVSVFPREQNSKKITILGHVAKPGQFPYSPGLTVIDVISLAGGFTPLAAKNKSSLTRLEGGRKTVRELSLGDIEMGRAANVPLRPGDIITVPERIF